MTKLIQYTLTVQQAATLLAAADTFSTITTDSEIQERIKDALRACNQTAEHLTP